MTGSNVPGTAAFWTNASSFFKWGLFLTGTVLCLSLIGVLIVSINPIIRRWHYKYHRFRTLAEVLRIQIYWSLAGLQHVVSSNFRSHQIEDIDWIRIAVNGLDTTLSSPEDFQDPVKNLRFVNKIWLENEKNRLFKKLEKKPLSESRFFKTLRDIGFVTIVCFGIIYAPIRLERFQEVMKMNSRDAWTVVMVLKLCFSIIISLYLIHKARQRMFLIEKYRLFNKQLLVPYMLADYLMDTVLEGSEKNGTCSCEEECVKKCHEILHQLGQEALAKRAEWFLAANERDLRSPK